MPKSRDSAVSDLFVWVNDGKIRTVFDLVDTFFLFQGKSSSATLKIFDNSGGVLFQKVFHFEHRRKIRLDFSDFLRGKKELYGTFAIFHNRTPQAILENDSFIAERGYVGYSLIEVGGVSYAHGNHDAISYDRENGSLDILGGTSLLKRSYNLQYTLQTGSKYIIFVVNNSSKTTNIELNIIHSTDSHNVILCNSSRVDPGGVGRFEIDRLESQCRVVVTSNLVMARPVVCRIDKNNLDCFHG